MSRFPKLTETFILYEMLTLEKLGVPIEVFPLLRERQKVVHLEAQRLTERAHFHPFFSFRILLAHWYYIRQNHRVYFRLLVEVLKGTFGSLNFFVGALGIFPKTVLFAYEMERLSISHVHAHFANHPALAAFIIHRLTGISYSFTAHGSDLHVERRMLDKKIESASFVVTVSSYNKELMVKECGEQTRDKIHVLHCGVDTNLFRPISRRETAEPLRIICVASFEEVKGHTFLVEACRLLAGKGLSFKCDLVGEGPLRRKIEHQIEQSGLSKYFFLHGGLPRNEVLNRLAISDIFVLASVPTKQGKREGIPIVLMEAMASGLPVVSSDLSGIPELVENGIAGILVPPKDSQLLAGALEKLYQDPQLRKKMGEAGRQQILAEFDLTKNASRIAGLFRMSQAGSA